MALKRKAIKGAGITQLRPTIATADGAVRTETQTYTGPYAQLKAKQESLVTSAKATSLEPTEADHGRLTITTEKDIPGSTVPPVVILEVVWQELRKPIETAPMFAELTTEQIKDAKDKADSSGPAEAPDNELASKLYDYLVKGTTEWSTGVPLVRRTTENAPPALGSGNAWFRDEPPVAVDGTWEFLKTADERRRQGRATTRIEEWQGAETWDPDLYP